MGSEKCNVYEMGLLRVSASVWLSSLCWLQWFVIVLCVSFCGFVLRGN